MRPRLKKYKTKPNQMQPSRLVLQQRLLSVYRARQGLRWTLSRPDCSPVPALRSSSLKEDADPWAHYYNASGKDMITIHKGIWGSWKRREPDSQGGSEKAVGWGPAKAECYGVNGDLPDDEMAWRMLQREGAMGAKVLGCQGEIGNSIQGVGTHSLQCPDTSY